MIGNFTGMIHGETGQNARNRKLGDMIKTIHTVFTGRFPNYYRQHLVEIEQLRIKHGDEAINKAEKLALATNKTIKYWAENPGES